MPQWDRAWRQATNIIAREIDARVAATYGSLLAGRLTEQEAVAVIASLIARGQRRAVTANDLLLAQELSDQLGRDVAMLGLEWPETVTDQQLRLAKATRTVLGTDIGYVAAITDPKARAAALAASNRERLARLTTGEVERSSQWARQEAGVRHAPAAGLVGYYRQLNPGACELCRTIGGNPTENYVHPLTHRFASHPTGSCKCSMRFVDIEYIYQPGVKWRGAAGTKPQRRSVAA